jgi:S1-C subfamily serine protease
MDNNVSKKGIAGYWLVTMFVAISFAIVFITSGLLYFLQAPAQFDSFERTAKTWTDRVVKVTAGGEVSTGFVMESEDVGGENYVYVVTSYHGVDTAISSVKITLDGESYDAENLSWNENIDLAIFKVKSKTKYVLPSAFEQNVGVEVMALGYAEGITLCAETGVVNSVDYLDDNASLYPLLCYDVSAYVRGGMSGCPILTKGGKIVGMGVRTKVDNVEGEEIHFSSDNYVVPISVILAEYDRALNHKTAPKTQFALVKGVGVIEFVFENATVTYDGISLKIGDDKVVSVNGQKIESAVDFLAKMLSYENRAGNSVKVKTESEEILVKVINE